MNKLRKKQRTATEARTVVGRRRKKKKKERKEKKMDHHGFAVGGAIMLAQPYSRGSVVSPERKA